MSRSLEEEEVKACSGGWRAAGGHHPDDLAQPVCAYTCRMDPVDLDPVDPLNVDPLRAV